MGFFIFDLIVLIVLILAVVQGYRKGFVLTLCGFLAVFVAFIGASILSDALAGPVSQAITPAIESGIQDTVGSYYQYTPPVEDSGFPWRMCWPPSRTPRSTAASPRISSRRWRTVWRPSPPTPSGRWRSMWRCS